MDSMRHILRICVLSALAAGAIGCQACGPAGPEGARLGPAFGRNPAVRLYDEVARCLRADKQRLYDAADDDLARARQDGDLWKETLLADADETRRQWQHTEDCLLAETDAARDRLEEARATAWHDLDRARGCLRGVGEPLPAPTLCPPQPAR